MDAVPFRIDFFVDFYCHIVRGRNENRIKGMKLDILHISRVRGQNCWTFIFSALFPTLPNPDCFISTTCRFLWSWNYQKNQKNYLKNYQKNYLKNYSKIEENYSRNYSKIRFEPFLAVFHLPTSWLISLHFRGLLARGDTPTDRFLVRRLGLCHWNYKWLAFCRMVRRRPVEQFWIRQS